jgi:hypothetical protein
MATNTGREINKRFLIFVPLNNIIPSITAAMQIVIDIFGSNITSAHIDKPAKSSGIIVKKLLVLSFF